MNFRKTWTLNDPFTASSSPAFITVGACISIAVMALVLWAELRNINARVTDQASVASERLRWTLMADLDAPGLGDHARIQRALEKPLSNTRHGPQKDRLSMRASRIQASLLLHR